MFKTMKRRKGGGVLCAECLGEGDDHSIDCDSIPEDIKEARRPYFMLIVEGGIGRIECMRAGYGLPKWDHINYDTDGASQQELCKCRIHEIDADHFHH